MPGVHRPPGSKGRAARPARQHSSGFADLHGLDAVWFLTDQGVLGKTVRHRLNRDGGRQATVALYPIVLVRLRYPSRPRTT
jgi:hypothetical protein